MPNELLWEHLTTTRPAVEDPGIVPAWKAPTEEKTLSEVEQLRQATVQNAAILQNLLQQNQQTNTLQQQSLNVMQRGFQMLATPPAQRQDAPADKAGVDWASIVGGQAEDKGKKAPSITPEAIQGMVAEGVRQGFVQQSNQYTEIQRITQTLDADLRKNHPELVQHYDILKDKFADRARVNGGDLYAAYADTVAYGKNLLPYLNERQTPAPSGGGSQSDAWIPNTVPARNKERVRLMDGQEFTIDRYLDGILPLVEFGEKQEEKQLNRYADFRNAHIAVRKGEMSEDSFKKEYPELAAVGGY